MTNRLTAPFHWTDNRIHITLVGAGGNGSETLDALAQFHHALVSLGHPGGLFVRVFDGGTVRESNLVRQRFWPCDLGANKAISLVNRYNMMLGLDWEAVPDDLDPNSKEGQTELRDTDLLITAVDLPSVRATISKVNQPFIWLDMGNKQSSGQVVLGWHKKNRQFPVVTDHYPEILSMADDNSKSCSTAESLQTQDAMTNRTIATAGMNLVWQLLRQGYTDINAIYIDLKTGQHISEGFQMDAVAN